MSTPKSSPEIPRAIIHKRILELAQRRPNDSIEELAEGVSGASMTLVERVLDEYGDPMDSEIEVETSTQASAPDRPGFTVLEELSETQIETLRAIYEHPTATQRELGDILGITGGATCQRIKNIEGMDWEKRQEYVNKVFGNGLEVTEIMPSQKLTETEGQLTGRIEHLEERIEEFHSESQSIFEDPEFVHKVVYACLESETISKEEELQILKELLK